MDLDRFFFFISYKQIEEFKILGVGQVMILRKGEPCILVWFTYTLPCSGLPDSPWGQHGAHLGPVSPRWAPRWPHEPCYQDILSKPSLFYAYWCYGFSCCLAIIGMKGGGLWCQKNISRAWMKYCTPQDTVGCSNLCMPLIPYPCPYTCVWYQSPCIWQRI